MAIEVDSPAAAMLLAPVMSTAVILDDTITLLVMCVLTVPAEEGLWPSRYEPPSPWYGLPTCRDSWREQSYSTSAISIDERSWLGFGDIGDIGWGNVTMILDDDNDDIGE